MDKLDQWIKEEHRCEHCGKIMTEFYGSGRFCSQSCANSKIQTSEINKKRGNTLHNNKVKEYYKNPNFCKICGKILPYEYKRRRKKTCSEECHIQLLKNNGLKGGLNSAQNQNRRSKNEIEFCELCEEYFGKDNVLHNEPIFNGWDADIIIPELKIAIVWNGIWHYKQIYTKQSLKQIQNRDNLKIQKIKENEYIPYIIKDMGKYNKKKVKEEFNKLLQFINEIK